MPWDTNEYLSPHFQLWEFLHNRSTAGLTPEIYANLKRLAEKLERVRKVLGNRPIHITSGFRTPAHNAASGGRPNSWHMKGLAVDFQHDSLDAESCRKRLDDWWAGGMELGVSWCHLDLRGHRERFHA